MIIYNITTKVQHSIAVPWLQWLKNIHVTDIMESDCFTEFKIVKLMEVDEADGPTFAVQFFAENKALYNLYREKYSSEIQKRSFEKWGNQFIAFRSVMQIVD